MKRVSLLFLLVLAAIPAAAQSLDWSAPGSTGVADDGTVSSGLYIFSGASFAVKSNAIATIEARYPVTNTYGSATSKTPAWSTLKMTYSDNSSTAGSVVAALMEVDKCSATETQLCSITSADGDGSITCDVCTWNGGLDFANHAYYVDVTITKTDTPAAPKLYQLAIY